jgi:hypothetical protein
VRATKSAAASSALVDGAYQQIETFTIVVKTKAGLKTFDFTYEELVALRDVVDALIALHDEARLWPFGELEKRKTDVLPVPA